MNAVRIRKENQVISAEEKRGILKMQAEEKAKREGQIISSFRERMSLLLHPPLLIVLHIHSSLSFSSSSRLSFSSGRY
jgi:hypothetical protein